MTMFYVEWSIDIEAKDATEAARIAREIQLDHNNIATVYAVKNTETRYWDFVDLALEKP